MPGPRSNSSQRRNKKDNQDARGEVAAMLSEIKLKLDTESSLSKERFDNLFVKLEDLSKENAQLKEEIVRMDKKIVEQNDDIHALSKQVNVLLQDKIINDIVIKGVPEVDPKENLSSLVLDIVSKLNIEIPPFSIRSVKRVGYIQQGKSRPIIVTLTQKDVKNKIIKAKRAKELNASMFKIGSVALGGTSDKIFIDEHLTKTNLMLFMEARKLRQLGIKYVWTSDGNILTRRSDKESVVRVKDFIDLSNTFAKMSSLKSASGI